MYSGIRLHAIKRNILALGTIIVLVPALFGLTGCTGRDVTDPDDAMLGSAEQALNAPVCLSIQRGTSGTVADAQIVSDRPTTNYGAKSAATINGGSVNRQLLFRFDVSAIPSTVTITSAYLTLSAYQQTFGASGTLHAHKILAPWVEGTVTWAVFQGSFSPIVEASAISNRSVSSPISLDVKSLVQGWVGGAFANQGVLMEQQESTITGIGTSESTSITSRPKLEICYVPDTGQSNTAMVSAGGVSRSGRYTMVHALGQSTQNQGKSTSQHYGLRGGLVGQNGSIP
ncbi:MAG TPA: DNRLRE domain-containing protein [Polyangium sp.]|nr:DNRLRE domain-containing protein [Polyangium sp.]